MQGLHHQVDTDLKAEYINRLLRCGFDTVDFGSFVSPKAVPQMADTAAVLDKLNLEGGRSKLLAIVANTRGATDACAFEEIDYLGFPFSISETFQQRNTGSSIDQSLLRVEQIQSLCQSHGKKLVVYISMAFGNPYGDSYHPDVAVEWAHRLSNELEVEILAMSDTVGSSTPEVIRPLFESVIGAFPKVEIGAHLHSTPQDWKEKIDAAYGAGCRRFDGALKGYGGCPMAADDLTGNVPTEGVVAHLEQQGIRTGINTEKLAEAMLLTPQIFLEG